MNKRKEFSMDAEDQVWQCECGGNTFRILKSGDVICVACDGCFPAAKILFVGANTERTQ